MKKKEIKKMKKKLLYLLIVLVLFIAFSLTVSATQLPTMIRIATSSLGSGTYAKAAIFSDIIKEATKIDVRIMPNDSQVGVALVMRSKEMDCAFYTGTGMFYLAHGLNVFGSADWGPQSIRSTLMGIAGCAFAVPASSDIKEWEDMKGKRVAVSPGTPIVADATFAFLAYGGITPDDVVQTVVSGMGGAYNALIDGITDGAFLPFGGSAAYKMEGSPRGLRWLSMDPNNEEGWKRLQKYLPMYGPFISRIGAGCSEENPIVGGGYILGIFAYNDASSDIIYAASKAIYEGYDAYKDVSKDLKYWDQKMLLDYEKQILPMHDGTVRFLKDIGKWTPGMEKWQAWKVKQENGRLEAWLKIVEMAKDKEIEVGSKEFLTMWGEYLWQNGLVSNPGKVPAGDLK